MICAISGTQPDEPVVSKVSGHVFEKRLITKYLETHNNTCPVTNQTLTIDDLIEVKVNRTVPPRPATATSIPAMLMMFQNEWDAVMFETYSLKQQLENVRQELAHSLYQHDAACRVIARLIKERDEAKRIVENLKAVPSGPQTVPTGEGMEVESGLPESVKSAMIATSKELSKDRKSRQPSAELATADAIKSYNVINTVKCHSPSNPGIQCIDVKNKQILTGGTDGVVILCNSDTKKFAAEVKAHSKKVTDVMFHPTSDLLFSCSSDKTAKMWHAEGNTYKSAFTATHNGEVVSCSLQPTGSYWVTGSADSTWAFHDIENATTLASVPCDAAVTTLEFHPDGLLMGVGDEHSVVKMWEVNSQKSVAVFEGHKGKIVDIAFSENGYYVCSVAEDNRVKLWDLRKLKDLHTIELPDNFKATSLQFDYSGTYLAVSGEHVRVFMGKTLHHVASFEGHSKPISEVKWGVDAKFLACAGMDNLVKIFGHK